MAVRIGGLAVLAAMMGLGTLAPAQAESLAGQIGDKRYPVNLNNTEGTCGKAYQAYLAAAGHSAYAQTPRGDGFICGVAINRKSQHAAEDMAVKNCASGVAKFKIGQKGRCQVYVSK